MSARIDGPAFPDEMKRWGDAHRAPDGPPTLIVHAGCGGDVTAAMACERCGVQLSARDLDLKDGPGATPDLVRA